MPSCMQVGPPCLPLALGPLARAPALHTLSIAFDMRARGINPDQVSGVYGPLRLRCHAASQKIASRADCLTLLGRVLSEASCTLSRQARCIAEDVVVAAGAARHAGAGDVRHQPPAAGVDIDNCRCFWSCMGISPLGQVTQSPLDLQIQNLRLMIFPDNPQQPSNKFQVILLKHKDSPVQEQAAVAM
jgi:hypothetical protein